MSRKISRLALLAVTAAVPLLNGCSSPALTKELVGVAIRVPYTPTAEDRAKLPADPNFKLQPAPPGKAVIYVYRNSQLYASALDYQVYLNGQLSSEIANGRYVRLEVEPGEHTLHLQRPQYVPDKPQAADDLNNIQPVPKAVRRVRLDPDEVRITRLNVGERKVGFTLYKTFELVNIEAEEGVFDMSRLQPVEK